MKWDSFTLDEHMKYYLEQGFDKKEAMKAVAKDRGISKREIYQMLIKQES
jgi:16S rRNA (cytidine1402-2'-O)-methyltransferase